VRVLSVDPSIGNIGVALVNERYYEWSYTFRTSPKVEMPIRLAEITEHFSKYLVEDHDIGQVIVEQPGTFMRKGKKGLLNVGPIQMLEMSMGAIVGILAQGFPVEFVRVDDWKGNKPKRTIQTWAFSECGVHLNDHEAEAFIMALQWRSKVRLMNSIRRARGKKKGEGKK